MSKDRYDIYDDYDSPQHKRSSKKRSSSKGKKRRKKKRSLKAKFFMVLFIVLFIYCVGAFAYFGYQYYIEDSLAVPKGGERESIGLLDQFVKPKLKERTTFLMLGTDKDGDRTDTIMVCCYNDALGELNVISIPRDTLVEVSPEAFEMLREEYPEPGQRGMKINEITHYGIEKYGIPLLEDQIESIIGVPIDFYCKVSFEGFNYLIDAMGGVQYNVPQQMDYDDPDQDLHIHLKAGMQTLKGSDAQGLVRFRSGYSNADIGRISVQQDFCKELLKQLVNKDAFFRNASAYMTTMFKYVETDVKLSDAIKYMSIVKDFNPANVYTATIPGYIGGKYGFVGGYILNDEEVKNFCYNIFQKPVDQIRAEREAAAAAGATGEAAKPVYNDKTLDIQVLNGGYTNGKASEVQSKLTAAGYKVNSIGTHSGTKTNNTRIYVKAAGMGEEVAKQFPGSQLTTDASIASDHDIVIIIGIDEK